MLPDLLHGNEKRVWVMLAIKRIFKYTKVRYRGIRKKHEWLLTAFAVINLYQHRKWLVPLGV